jgi:hypothetical protein
MTGRAVVLALAGLIIPQSSQSAATQGGAANATNRPYRQELLPHDRGEYIQVNIRGRIRLGVVAIGGETTGTTITSRGITWDLDLGRSSELRRAAERLSGSTVLVSGSLSSRRGVELPSRWIVRVESLRRAEYIHPHPYPIKY